MFYTAVVEPHLVKLSTHEVKMLMAAIRQVEHTFTIAVAQSQEAGEPLAGDYDDLREAYAKLYRRLSSLTGDIKPHLVK